MVATCGIVCCGPCAACWLHVASVSACCVLLYVADHHRLLAVCRLSEHHCRATTAMAKKTTQQPRHTSPPGRVLRSEYRTDCTTGTSSPATGRVCQVGHSRGCFLAATFTAWAVRAAASCNTALLLCRRCIVPGACDLLGGETVDQLLIWSTILQGFVGAPGKINRT